MGQEKYKNGTKFTVHEEVMYEPLKWKKPRRIFVNSVSDTFHEEMPNGTLQRFFQNVVSATPQHQYLLLTKRPEIMFDFFTGNRVFYPANMPNVWIGVTAENQEMADKRLPILKEIPARIRFVSVEPMLGPVDLSAYAEWLDWVIIGCESGPKRRHVSTEFIESLIVQCKAMGVPVFLKQMEVLGKVVSEPSLRLPEAYGGTQKFLEYPSDAYAKR
jgi:protein gp37